MSIEERLSPLDRVRQGKFIAAVRDGPSPRDFTGAPAHFSVSGLTVFYNRKERRHERVALENVDFTIKQGEVVYVMGESGSGKSTLLDILAHRSQAKLVEDSVNVRGSVFFY